MILKINANLRALAIQSQSFHGDPALRSILYMGIVHRLMKRDEFIGTRVAMILAILSILWTVLIIAAGLYYQFIGLESNTPESNESAARMILLFCTPVNVIFTVIFIILWYVKKKREDVLKGLASYLKMYRRIPLSKVAQRMGITEQNAETLLLECVAKGIINGFLDRETDEFVLEKSIESMRVGAKCPRCGAFSDKVALSGEVVTCAYCGAPIPTEERPKATKPKKIPKPKTSSEPQRFCSYCGGNARYIEDAKKWYCDKCGKYYQ